MQLNLANRLTLGRIAAIPMLLATMTIAGWPGAWLSLTIFAAACATDWFDGYVARKYNQKTALGRFLDPIADKLLVASVLLMLVSLHRVTGVALIAAIIILCREIFISGLREFLAEYHVALPVTRLAKWKTAVQMIALGLLILGDAGTPGFAVAGRSLAALGSGALILAALFTLVTGYSYVLAARDVLGGDL